MPFKVALYGAIGTVCRGHRCRRTEVGGGSKASAPVRATPSARATYRAMANGARATYSIELASTECRVNTICPGFMPFHVSAPKVDGLVPPLCLAALGRSGRTCLCYASARFRRGLTRSRLPGPLILGSTERKDRMELKLHHVNYSTTDVGAVADFYRSLFNLKPVLSRSDNQIMSEGYGGKVEFLTDGTTEFHIALQDLGVAFRTKQSLNPLDRGHIAFRTDDIEAFKAMLREKNIPFADYGVWAMGGWYQIFLQDPNGTIIEVHQADYKPVAHTNEPGM